MPIPVTDLISTTSPSDTYATHDASTGRGGHRTVDTYNDMLLITDERRTSGMQVHVKETDRLYRLSNSQMPWTTVSDDVLVVATALDAVDDPGLYVGRVVYASDTSLAYTIDESLFISTDNHRLTTLSVHNSSR